MRILFVCGAGKVFGRETVTLTLMKGLREKGHDVTCVTSTWSNGEFEKRVDALSIPFFRLPLGFISKTLSLSALGMTFEQVRKLPSLWLSYKRIIETLRPDVVVHSAFHHAFLLMPLLGNSINVFHVHDAFAPTRFYRTIFKAFNKRMDAFVGVSRFVTKTLTSLGIPQAKVHCVLNGISMDASTHFPTNGKCGKGNPTRQSLPLRIGIVGQVAEWKGHEDLVEALHILDGGGKKFVCKIFGDGSEEFANRLKSQISKYGLTENVEWMGFVGEKSSIYKEIDICVTPSRVNEAFGLAAAEAAMFAVPVVATRCGALSEVVIEAQTGYLVDANSPAQIAERICRLSSSRDSLLMMGQTAAEHIRATFSTTKMTEKMETLFQSLVLTKVIERSS